MARLRYNGLSTTLGASLTNSATSVTFNAALTHSNGTAVPTISGSDYVPLAILDSSGHLSEIVWLTAYTSGATTGTITRGQEGTSGVAHSSGDKVVCAVLGKDVSFVGAEASRTTTQSISSGAYNTVVLNTSEEYDTDGIHDLVANPSRFTIPAGMGGRWRFNAVIEFAGNSSGQRILGWNKNGTFLGNRYIDCRPTLTTAAYGPILSTSVDLLLAAGDYIEAQAFQDSGGSLNMVSARVTCEYLG